MWGAKKGAFELQYRNAKTGVRRADKWVNCWEIKTYRADLDIRRVIQGRGDPTIEWGQGYEG